MLDIYRLSFILLLGGSADVGEVGEYLLGVLSLAGAGLTTAGKQCKILSFTHYQRKRSYGYDFAHLESLVSIFYMLYCMEMESYCLSYLHIYLRDQHGLILSSCRNKTENKSYCTNILHYVIETFIMMIILEIISQDGVTESLTLKHVVVGAVRDGEQVRRHFITPLALVNLDHTVGVDGIALVRVDDHTEETRVGVNEPGYVASLQVVQHRGIVQVGQV